MTITGDPVTGVPPIPYRGIDAFRYVDHAIFFARAAETRRLASLVSVYRGVMLYGSSGTGKSSLINAGLLPEMIALGYSPDRVRVQPRAGEELVIEPIATSDEGGDTLPSLLAGDDRDGAVVLSIAAFEERVQAVSVDGRPLIIFDQFEEIVTLFEQEGAHDEQRALVEMIVGLLHGTLKVKVLLVFREDYLGKVKELLGHAAELVDRALRLAPVSPQSLQLIIRGPFERYPGHFARELSPEVADQLGDLLAERFGSGDLSLSEVQTVCLRLWQSGDPETVLASRGVQGLLEDHLGEALDAFPSDLHDAAVAVLAQMVTSAGTRNVISAEDVVHRVHEAEDDDEDIPAPLILEALERLESQSRLVRRERRRDIHLYEIASEFLVPWITRRREEQRLVHEGHRAEQQRAEERRRELRRLRILGSIAGVLVLVAGVVAGLAVWALHQRGEARRQTANATSLALASASADELPFVALPLAFEAYRDRPRAEAHSAVLTAIEASRQPYASRELLGHTAPVLRVAFSPDGRTLVSSDDDNVARIWDLRTHRQAGAPLTGHTKLVGSVAFSPSGRVIATGSNDRTVRLWSARTHKQLGAPLPTRSGVAAVAFSQDGQTLASAGKNDTIRLWDVGTHRQLGTLGGRLAYWSLAFAPDGRTLAAGGKGGAIWRWDVRARKPLSSFATHSQYVDLAFGPDGRTLVSGTADGRIRRWSVRTGRLLGPPFGDPKDTAFSYALSADGRRVAAGLTSGVIQLWDLRTAKRIAALRGHISVAFGLAFSHDGRTLASASNDETVRLWSLRVPQPLHVMARGHTGAVEAVAFSPDGRALASASDDHTIRLWNARTHEQLGKPLTGHTNTVGAVAFSPDGRALASASDDHTIRLWDARTHKQLGKPLTGHTRSVFSVAFSPDGRLLASASEDKTIRLWDVRSHRQLDKPLTSRDEGWILHVAFSPDGSTLVSAGHSTTVQWWSVRTHKLLGEAPRTNRILDATFAPDGRTVASAGADATVRVWDARSHAQLGTPLTGHAGAVLSLAFAPDGRTLASSGDDGGIRLWDARTHTQLGAPLTGQRGSVNGVAFSPDGRTLASAGSDGTVAFWPDLLWRDFAELRTRVCALTSGGLTPTEWRHYVPGIPYRNGCS